MGKPQYKCHYGEQVSEYEDADGSTFTPGSVLGAGKYAQARELTLQRVKTRRFRRRRSPMAAVVLSPVGRLDIAEAQKKLAFFRDLYPTYPSEFFSYTYPSNYRLVLPKIPGIPVKQHTLSPAPLEQINFFLSLVQSLKICHAKKWVCIDYSENNVLYDATTGMTYLIDGGQALKVDQALPGFFSLSVASDHPSYDPECFKVGSTAQTSMDVYSLGSTLQYLFMRPGEDKETYPSVVPDPAVEVLYLECLKDTPASRPTLENLEARLRQMRQKYISSEEQYTIAKLRLEACTAQTHTLKDWIRTIIQEVEKLKVAPTPVLNLEQLTDILVTVQVTIQEPTIEHARRCIELAQLIPTQSQRSSGQLLAGSLLCFTGVIIFAAALPVLLSSCQLIPTIAFLSLGPSLITTGLSIGGLATSVGLSIGGGCLLFKGNQKRPMKTVLPEGLEKIAKDAKAEAPATS